MFQLSSAYVILSLALAGCVTAAPISVTQTTREFEDFKFNFLDFVNKGVAPPPAAGKRQFENFNFLDFLNKGVAPADGRLAASPPPTLSDQEKRQFRGFNFDSFLAGAAATPHAGGGLGDLKSLFGEPITPTDQQKRQFNGFNFDSFLAGAAATPPGGGGLGDLSSLLADAQKRQFDGFTFDSFLGAAEPVLGPDDFDTPLPTPDGRRPSSQGGPGEKKRFTLDQLLPGVKPPPKTAPLERTSTIPKRRQAFNFNDAYVPAEVAAASADAAAAPVSPPPPPAPYVILPPGGI